MNEAPTQGETPADTLAQGLGALAMCLARRLSPAQRAAFAVDLASLAAHSAANGNAELQALLLDLHAAAR